MTITYGMTKEIYCLGASERTAYGIAVYSDAEAEGTATVIDRIEDISPDAAKVEELVSLCNSLELSPMHLHDVVEDFVG